MIINKNSWHYKMIEKFEFAPEDSLCPYIRQLCVSFLLAGILCLLGVMATIILGDTLAWLLAMLVSFSTIAPSMLAIVGTIIILFCIFIASIAVYKDYQEAKRNKLYEQMQSLDYVEPTPNIFMAYFSAIHNKICPSIEFK